MNKFINQNVKLMELLQGKIAVLGEQVIDFVANKEPKGKVVWDPSRKDVAIEAYSGVLVCIRREKVGNRFLLAFDFKHLVSGDLSHYRFDGLPLDAKIKVTELLNELHNK
jgi:hypothetical protein